VRRAPVEASALPASVGLARSRVGLGVSLLRLRSDEQLVSLVRAGNEDAFRVIHDRYRGRMHAYARQMLSTAACDPEDVVQEIFVRAYAGLRANRRDLALRAWLYRIAHNRCIDEIRRPQAIAVEAVDELGESRHADPHLRAEQREALRRLIADVQRLPEQQRSALLMRELGGMPYADLSGALGVSVPAVKSLLVRARVGLVQASEARDTDCASIREDLITAHDRGVRASGRARRHMRDCSHCRQFRREVHGSSRRFALLLPAVGPVAAAAKLLGIGTLGGGGAAAGSSTGAAAGSTAAAAGSSGAAASSTAVAAGGGAGLAGGGAAVAGGGAVVAGGTVVVGGGAVAGGAVAAGGGAIAGGALAAAGAGHVATILAATVVAAGSAIGIQQAASAPHPHGARGPAAAAHHPSADASAAASTLAAVTHGAGGAAPSAVGPAAARPAGRVGRGGPRAGGRSDGGTASLRPTGPVHTAGTAPTSTATGAGSGTATSTTTTGTVTTTTTGTATTGASTTPATTTPTTGTPATGTPGWGTPVSGDPTSTGTTTAPTGSAPPTSTTPVTSAPTSTSAATTAAHLGRSGGGSTVLPRIRPGRMGGGSLRGGARGRLVLAGLFSR
jgi:RNA polymerase sigma factor (sigma-70 family)